MFQNDQPRAPLLSNPKLLRRALNLTQNPQQLLTTARLKGFTLKSFYNSSETIPSDLPKHLRLRKKALSYVTKVNVTSFKTINWFDSLKNIKSLREVRIQVKQKGFKPANILPAIFDKID